MRVQVVGGAGSPGYVADVSGRAGRSPGAVGSGRAANGQREAYGSKQNKSPGKPRRRVKGFVDNRRREVIEWEDPSSKKCIHEITEVGEKDACTYRVLGNPLVTYIN